MNFKTWLNEDQYNFPIPREEAVRKGFLFHGIGGDSSIQELLDSEGFRGGGFADKPIQYYGPNYIAARQQDMPKPYYSRGGDNVLYSFNEPFRDFVPVRSEEEVKYWGDQKYAMPLKYIYRADLEGNVLGLLVGSDGPQ